jgi:lipoprotein-releasing system permease protein
MSSIGIGMGFLGVGIGVSFGLLVGEILERTRWIKIPPDVYYIGFLPVIVNPTELILICGMALMITVIATLYPAYRVARLSPLEGIREDRA